MSRDYKIWAVDFDGTLCVNDFPRIGEPNLALIADLIGYKKNGDKVILWTNREGEKLKEAIIFCRSHGLEFDIVNDNLPEIIEDFGYNPRKVFADEYIDDRAANKERFNIPYHLAYRKEISTN